MAWYNKDADDSYRLLGGLILMLIFLTGAFLADIFTENQYLSPEIMHSILGFLSGAVLMGGRRSTNENGVSETQPESKPKRKIKPFRRAD